MPRGPQQSRLQAGQQVGEWKLLTYEPLVFSYGRVQRKARWKCQCSCGTVRYVQADNLASGQTRSCGHAGIGRRLAKNDRQPARSVFDLAGMAAS